MKVGFIGLGMMGSGMARNLIKAGHTLIVFNRTRSRAQELAQLGATVAATPGEAAGNAEVLITMLADDHALEDAILGPGRALQSLPAGAIHVGMSTISVAMSRRLQAAHRERQQHYVAAPVFGRPEAAEAAKLFIVVAGPAAQIQLLQVLAAAEEAAVPMPMASLVHDRFVDAIAQGLTEADWTAIARISFQRAGLEKAA